MKDLFNSYDSVAEFCDVFGQEALDKALTSDKFNNDQKCWIKETIKLASMGRITLSDFDDGNNWKHTYLTWNPKSKDVTELLHSTVHHSDTGYGNTSTAFTVNGSFNPELNSDLIPIVIKQWVKFKSINGVSN